MVVQVFVAQGDRKDALRQKAALGVNDRVFIAGAGDTGIQRVDQPQPPMDLSREHHAGARCPIELMAICCTARTEPIAC